MRPLVLAALALLGLAARAETPEEAAARHWRGLAEADLEAARRMVADNHPGAVPEIGDAAFRDTLDRNTALARERAAQVRDLAGHMAVLEGFATGFGDKHIYVRPLIRGARYRWAGLVVARGGGGGFVVTTDARPDVDQSLVGAGLVGCDGTSAEVLGEERLGGFRADWAVEAQRIQTAPWLLIDDGNPFLSDPARCVFERDGVQAEVELRWEPVAPATLQAALTEALESSLASAGFEARPFDGGWWIGLGALDERAQPIIDQVRADLDAVRAAPQVVLDVRGNGGGNSAYARELLLLLTGDSGRKHIDRTGRQDCQVLWRASPGNLEALGAWRLEQAPHQDDDTRAWYQALESTLADAVEQGRPFDRPVQDCRGKAQDPPARQVRSALQGRLVLLTDGQCFSSCLLMVQQVRALGGLHVGAPTDAATRYMEVREETLPSGLAAFTTLQKVDLGSPPRIGPFEPTHHFDGDMSDTAALEAWVTGLPRGR